MKSKPRLPKQTSQLCWWRSIPLFFSVLLLGSMSLNADAPDQNPPPCAVSLSASSANASCPGSSDGSVSLTPSGGVAPYRYGEKVLDYDFSGTLDNTQFSTTNMSVNNAGSEVRLTPQSGGWASQLQSTQSFAREDGLTFEGSVFIPHNGYKAVMVGFHDGITNGTTGIAHGLFFFDNGTSSPVSISAREGGAGAANMPTSSYTNNTSPGSWFDIRIVIHDNGATYSVKRDNESSFTNTATYSFGANPSTLRVGIQATTSGSLNYTAHKDWKVYKSPTPTNGLAAGSYTYFVEDANGCEAQTTVNILDIDNTPSVYNLTPDVTAASDANACTAVVNYTAPSATDNCQTFTVNQTAGLASGSSFPLGTTTNTYTIIENEGTSALYNFEGLNAGQSINGQDNWQVTGTVSSSIPTVQNLPASGAYAGSQGLEIGSLGGNNFAYASRINDANFSLPAATTDDIIEVVFDHDRNYWGSYMTFGRDNNNDGHISNSEITFAVFERNNGDIIQLFGPGRTFLGTFNGSQRFEWTQIKMIIDASANGGQGSISLEYRDLTGNGNFIAPASLQNLNIGLNPVGSDHTNIANINGMMYSHDAGEATRVDNISYTVKKKVTHSFDVTVEDNLAPAVLVQNITRYLDANGNVTIIAADIDNGSSDNCGINSLSLSQTNLSCNDIAPSANYSLDFTSSSHLVTIPSAVSTAMQNASGMSFGGWFKSNGSQGGDRLLLTTGTNWGDWAIYMDAADGGRPSFTVSGAYPNRVKATTSITDGNWYFVVGTWDGTNARIYINGSLENTNVQSRENNGGRTSKIGNGWYGKVDEVAFWDRALTAAEVSSLVGGGMNATNPIAYYDMNDGPGSNILDDKSSNTVFGNGTLSGLNPNTAWSNITAPVSSGSPITLTATDASGNSSSAQAFVTVFDTVAPSLSCYTFDAYLDNTGNFSLDPENLLGSSRGSKKSRSPFVGDGDDNCSLDTVYVSKYDFNCNDAGLNQVTVTAIDAYGNTSVCVANITVIDTFGSQAIAQDLTAYLDNSGSADITAADIDNGSTALCGIDTLLLDQYSFDCSQVGSNTVVLSLVDDLNNNYYDTAIVTVLDTISPDLSCASIDVYLDANGMFQLDTNNLLGRNKRGKGGSGSSTAFIASADENCTVASSTVSQSLFTCSDIGANSITVTVTDANGNVSTCVATVTVHDTISPVLATNSLNIDLVNRSPYLLSQADIDLLGSNSTDNCGLAFSIASGQTSYDCGDVGQTFTLTLQGTDLGGNMATVPVAVSVADPNSVCNDPPVAVCQDITVNVDGNCQATIVATDVDGGSSDPDGDLLTYNLDNYGPFTVGTHTVQLMVTDGEYSDSCTATVTVQDVTPPTALTQDITAYLDATGSVSISASNIDGGSVDNCGIANLSLNRTSFACSDVGLSQTVILTATDVNGNIATASAQVTVLDNIAPTAMAQDITIQLDGNGQASIVAADIDNGSSDNCGIQSLSISPNTFDCANIGANTVTLRVSDSNGNVSTVDATVTVEDITAPVFVCPADITVSAKPGFCSADVPLVFTPPTDNCGSSSITFTTAAGPVPLQGPNVAIGTFPVGTTAVTALVDDGNGNTVSCQFNVTVNDTTLPTVITQNVTLQLDANGQASITAQTIDNGSTDVCGIASIAVSETVFGCSDIGANTVILTVTDNNGNVNTAAAVVTIEDVTAPVFVCPSDITVSAKPGFCSADVPLVFTPPTDNCGNPIITFSSALGTVPVQGPNVAIGSFPVGTTAVTALVDDGNGNTVSCQFNVTVNDTTAPTVITQNITVQLDANGQASITAQAIDNGSTDACGIASISISETVFGCANVGTNTVILTVTDIHGNSATGAATVTVQDVTPPTVLAQGLTVYLDGNGQATITPQDADNGSSDNCGMANLIVVPSSFDCSSIGANTVTLTGEDLSGNQATATAVVIVLDTLAPVVSCTADISVTNDPGVCGATVTYSAPTAVDNCLFSVTQLSGLPSGSVFPIGTTTNTYVFTDSSNNSTVCSFMVTVVDDEVPVVHCQDVTVVLDQSGMASITAADIDAGSSDNCGIALITTSQMNFGCADLGVVPVTLTVLDIHGNSSSCVANVTVSEGNFLKLEALADVQAQCKPYLNGAKVHWDAPSVQAFSSCSGDTCTIQKNINGFTYLGERNGHRYYRSKSKGYTWFQAQAAANAAGGYLAVINDAAENHYIACRLSKGRAWIGLTDEVSEGQFVWEDGSAVSYSKWKRNEPNNKGGKKCKPDNGADYVTIKKWNGKWEDRKGCDRNEFIMEVSCGSSIDIQQIAGPASGSLFASSSTTTVTYVATDTTTGATDTMSFDVVVAECVPEYCSARGWCSSYEWIESVSIGSLTHTSGNDKGYGDHTSQVAHVNVGQNVNLTLTPGYAGAAYKEYWKVYVDWNRDGDFCDWGERVFYGKARNTINGSFTVPHWAAQGNLRMRIVMRWGYYGGHCGGFGYGEVEDYTIVVDDAGTVSSKKGAPTAQADEPIEEEQGIALEVFDLYPSPISRGDVLNLFVRSAEDREAQLQVFDLSGRLVYEQSGQLMEGENRMYLSTEPLAGGVYMVTLSGTGDALKFIVE